MIEIKIDDVNTIIDILDDDILNVAFECKLNPTANFDDYKKSEKYKMYEKLCTLINRDISDFNTGIVM